MLEIKEISLKKTPKNQTTKQMRSGMCFITCSKKVKHCQPEICCVLPNSFPFSSLLPGGMLWGAENTLTLCEHHSAITKSSWNYEHCFQHISKPILATMKNTNSIPVNISTLAGFPSVFRSPGSQSCVLFWLVIIDLYSSICRNCGKAKDF